MKHVYMIRHADAEPGAQMDDARPLTDDGKKKAEAMAKWMRGHIGRVDIVISSPFVRTMQTAEACSKELGAHVASTNGLEPEGRTAGYAWEEVLRLAQQSKDILLVGHGPALSTLCLWLMGYGTGDNEELRFDYASVARLKITEPRNLDPGMGSGKLQWLIEPELVLPAAEVVEASEALLKESAEIPVEATVKLRMISELEDGGYLVLLTEP